MGKSLSIIAIAVQIYAVNCIHPHNIVSSHRALLTESRMKTRTKPLKQPPGIATKGVLSEPDPELDSWQWSESASFGKTLTSIEEIPFNWKFIQTKELQYTVYTLIKEFDQEIRDLINHLDKHSDSHNSKIKDFKQFYVFIQHRLFKAPYEIDSMDNIKECFRRVQVGQLMPKLMKIAVNYDDKIPDNLYNIYGNIFQKTIERAINVFEFDDFTIRHLPGSMHNIYVDVFRKKLLIPNYVPEKYMDKFCAVYSQSTELLRMLYDEALAYRSKGDFQFEKRVGEMQQLTYEYGCQSTSKNMPAQGDGWGCAIM